MQKTEPDTRINGGEGPVSVSAFPQRRAWLQAADSYVLLAVHVHIQHSVYIAISSLFSSLTRAKYSSKRPSGVINKLNACL